MMSLTIDNVSFGYSPATPVVRDVSFGVRKGEFLSLVGPNGAGKTTLLRLLDRIYIPQRGTILLAGRPLAGYARSEIARRIAFVPQDTGILFPFTVMEIVLMGRAPHMGGKAFENAHDREVALSVMDLTDVAHLSHQPVAALSGGERQRVFIARSLAQQPEVILLDEPNAHLDIAHQVEVFTILKKLNRESGVTVVSVSHDLNLAASYSDRVAILAQGSLVKLGTPGEVLTGTLIKEIFRTEVLVDDHPSGKGPRITLLGSQ
jgi:iron complex transport system ATP-binding protein